MSEGRVVQVGDHAIVRVGDQVFDYLIRGISPEGIYISPNQSSREFSLLLPSPLGWYVYGLNLPHTIEFNAPEINYLSGLPELDELILLQLPYQDIVKTCQTNRGLAKVCQSEHFWYQMLLRDFGDAIKYKPQHENFRQQYQYLHDALKKKSPVREINARALDALIVLAGNGIYPTTLDVDTFQLVSQGELDMLQWLAQLPRPILPFPGNAVTAARTGNLRILQWMASLNPPISLTQEVVDQATRFNHLDVLKWLINLQPDLLPSQRAVDRAASNGYLNIVEYLGSLTPPILPSQKAVDNAATQGHIDVLKYLGTLTPPIYPSTRASVKAALNSRWNVINLIHDQRK